MTAPQGFADEVAFVWKVADRLRGNFKQHEYGSVMLPLLKKITGQPFSNTSPLTMQTIIADDKNIAPQLRSYIRGLSASAAEVIEA